MEPAAPRLPIRILPRYVAQDMLELVRDQRRVEMQKFMGTISRQEYDWYL